MNQQTNGASSSTVHTITPHQELELAKAEVTQKGKQAGAGAGLLGAAGAIGLAALGALTACFILA